MMALIPPSYAKMNGGLTELKPEDLVLECGPIRMDHVEAIKSYVEGDTPLGVDYHDVKVMRASHHKVARLLAAGVHDIRVAALTNYTQSRISTLKSNPAFQDLMRYYSKAVDEEYVDFHSAAADLGADALQELHRRLEEEPEKFSIAALDNIVKTTADRTGNGPVNRSLNVNVSANLGDRLKAARERAQAAVQAALTET